MKRSNLVFATTICMLISLVSGAQSMDFLAFTKGLPNYHTCAAILIGGEVLDKSYYQEDKPKMVMGMPGVLTVATVSMSDEGSTPIDNIKFQVAIKNERTNTMWIYPGGDMTELDLEELWKKCESGDRLIIMPIDQKYSLSQHELKIMDGC